MTTELDSEQAGFDSFDDEQQPADQATNALTETPGQGGNEGQKQEPAPEYVQWTKAEYDELKTRAALIDEIRATQDKSFGTFGRTIKGLSDKLAEFEASAKVEVSQEDIDTLRTDGFEPLAAALEKVRSLRAIPGAIDPSKIDELVQQRIAPALESIGSKVDQAVEARLLKRAHPDWQQVTATPEFNAYAASLPQAVQAELANSWDSDFIGEHLTKFKQSRKPDAKTAPSAPTQRTSRMQAAVTPRGTGKTFANTLSDEQSGFDSVT